ncbi:MAG: hypothetical protein K2K48_07095 [Anaeroplasmataceae bacterium]|nr:hypothetical protein [Anaeroplasmataceae bacterium]
MICYNCKKQFYVKRNFLSLFETKKYYICNACRSTYPIQFGYEEIPLENYTLFIVSIFKRTYKLNLDAYQKELSKIVEFLMKRYKDYFLVYLDSFKENDVQIECLSFLADTQKKSILLVCCELKK